jgi:fructoselysine-6-P-deglycase FrlB-like protein
MTDGTYLGPRAVEQFPDDVVSSQEQALGLWNAVDDYISDLGTLTRVFLVGAGGSLFAMGPAQYVLDRFAAVPSVSMNPDEFYHRQLAGVGPGALVIALSGTGNTKETIRAASWAAERGASVAVVTLKADGPLAQSQQNVFVAESGHGSQIVLQLVALAILKRVGVDVSAKLSALRKLPAALLSALENFEQRAAEIARNMKDETMTYVIASGSLQGAANTFTSCYLQEMQWKHAATVNADEFFQGPFEVFDKETRSVVYVPEDETRPMAERVRRFLDEYSGETYYIDSRDFDLPGIEAEQRSYVMPLVFHGLGARLAAHWSAVTGYALEGRRYMWQFDY